MLCWRDFLIVLLVSACAHTLCPPDFAVVSDKCVRVGPRTDWSTTLKECLRMESNTTLLHVSKHEWKLIVATLLDRGVTSVWVEARRTGPLGPIVYQLPTDPLYTTCVRGNQSHIGDLPAIWMEGEPTLDVKRGCMVLTVDNETGVPTTRAKLDACSSLAHNFVCVTHRCGSQDVRCQGQGSPSTDPELPATKLEIRQEGDKYFLDVYEPAGLWRLSGAHPKVVNPTCVIEDGIVGLPRQCLLDQQGSLSWTMRNLTGVGDGPLQFSISKTVYHIISENQGYLTCRALRADSLDAVVTSRQLFRRTGQNVYAASLVFVVGVGQCPLWKCEPTFAADHWQSLAANLTTQLRYSTSLKKVKVRPIKMADRSADTMTLVFRIEVPVQAHSDYQTLVLLRQGLNHTGGLVYVRSTRLCHPQDLGGPAAAVGQAVLPDELCVDGDGRAVQQHCRGDFVQGGFWAQPTAGTECIEPSSRTKHLYDLSQSKENASRTLQLLASALAEGGCTAADVLLASNVLAGVGNGNATLDQMDLPAVATVADSVMNALAANSSLRGASNASNVILESLDRLLNGVELGTAGFTLTVRPRFITLVVDTTADVRGLAVLNKKQQFFRQQDLVLLSSNSLDALLGMDVVVAVLLPPQLAPLRERHRLVISFFWDDSLFVSTARTPVPVVGVALDGVRHYDLASPLLLVFGSTGGECVFWNFADAERHGAWSDAGCTPGGRGVCVCTHLTHFGQLLVPTLTQEPSKVLDAISVVGCAVSLVGLGGVAVTAALFPAWRRGMGRKMQLHLCAALALLMGAFLLDATGWRRPVLGVVLHFSLLASFCWMLVAAWLQYRRLARPLTSLKRAPHVLLKAAIFAWGFPLVPCVTLLLVAPQVYTSPRCYPSGTAHMLSVLAPVAAVVSLNVAMFVLILRSICRTPDLHHNRHGMAARRLSTLVFLFSLLGLSWLFGVWQLPYLFCCTATLQGFAFFMFFVPLEKSTRARWQHLFCRKRSDPTFVLTNRSSLLWDLNRLSLALRRSTMSSSS